MWASGPSLLDVMWMAVEMIFFWLFDERNLVWYSIMCFWVIMIKKSPPSKMLGLGTRYLWLTACGKTYRTRSFMLLSTAKP
jgi:hypothetical protein